MAACRFIAVPHASQALPGKRKPRERIERSVSQAGWKSIVERAHSLRDATIFLSCDGGSISLARVYDYARSVTFDVRASSKALAGHTKHKRRSR